jgi:DNA primase catalytic core
MLIEQAMIQEVKARHELAAFIESKGVKLKKTGKVFQGLCPFHDDHKPSLIVDPEKQLWSCLGACKGNGNGKSGGDLYAFLMRLENLSFKEAHAALGGKMAKETPMDMKGKERVEILTRTVDLYHKALLESPEAQAYLKGRGFQNPDTWRAFRLGTAAGTLAAKAESRRLKAVGLMTATGKERFSGCITVPLLDGEAVVGIYGRKIKGVGHYYLPGPHRGLFNAAHASKSKEIILTESILDALSFIEAGFLNVIPLYGINGLTGDHLRFFEEYGIRSVALCLDTDEAGKRAIKGIKDKLLRHGLGVSVLTLPTKDPNELLVKEGVDGFRKILEGLLKREEAVPPPATSCELPATPHGLSIWFDEDQPEEDADPLIFLRDKRKYIIQGPPQANSSRLFVSLRLVHAGKNFVDRLDLYSARARQSFVNRVAQLTQTERQPIEEDLIFLIEKLEKLRDKEKTKEPKAIPLQMTEEERAEALALLKAPDLFDRIAGEMETLGYVGEDANKRLAYLVSVSRKLNEPLSLVILSQSGSGKSALAEITETLTPPEDVMMFSRLTPQALYYLDSDALTHKLVIIEERSGSEQADYSIRTLQTKKKLTLAAPIKDPATGKIKTVLFEIMGPTAFIESTTAPSINFENATRCFEIYLDESVEQTHRINDYQRFFKTEDGLLLKAGHQKLAQKHHHAQRLLKPLPVVIPFAKHIQFPDRKLRARRDNQRFLNLIEVLAYLHQYQRKRKVIHGVEVILAGIEDYTIALALAKDLLAETFRDCQKPLRDLLTHIEAMLKARAEKEKQPLDALLFTRKDVREFTGLPHQRIKRLFSELEEYEYIAVDKGPSGSRNTYRLMAGPEQAAALAGLLSPAELKGKYAWTSPPTR